MSGGWVEYDPRRRPPGSSSRGTWEQVKRERGWEQGAMETVAEMDWRLQTGLSPAPLDENGEPLPPPRRKAGPVTVLEVPPMSDRDWQRLRPNVPCLICGRTGWCTVAPDGDAIRCMRVQSDKPAPDKKGGQMGWLHPIPDHAATSPVAIAKPAPPVKKRSPAEWELYARQCRTALNPERLRKFAASLGVTVEALEAFGIGYDTTCGAWTWPMRDGARRVIGIRRRYEDARGYRCVPGSENGLFIPEDYSPRPGDPLLIPEGPTCAAAARDMGLRVVGRPNSSAGAALGLTLLTQGPIRQDVVVVGENDGPIWAKVPEPPPPAFPGFTGAVHCCRTFLPACDRLRCVVPPRPHKDLRDWRAGGGAKLSDVMEAIERATPIKPGWFPLAEAVIKRRQDEAIAAVARMVERIVAYRDAGNAERAARLWNWLKRRGYPIDVERQAAA